MLIDNFRLDQWDARCAPCSAGFFTVNDELYCSILPTATQYARNAIFSGLMPVDIAACFPTYGSTREADGAKHQREAPRSHPIRPLPPQRASFPTTKSTTRPGPTACCAILPSLAANDLNVVVINFIDMLSHARTESKMIARACLNRCRLPLAHRIVVPPLSATRPLPKPSPKGLPGSDHHRPRHRQSGQPGQGGRRPKHQHQPALQARKKPHLQPPPGI